MFYFFNFLKEMWNFKKGEYNLYLLLPGDAARFQKFHHIIHGLQQVNGTTSLQKGTFGHREVKDTEH